jgi:hypothetical protein
MAGLVPAIRVLASYLAGDVDARDKPGHDGDNEQQFELPLLFGPTFRPGRRGRASGETAAYKGDRLQAHVPRSYRERRTKPPAQWKMNFLSWKIGLA